MNSAPFRVGQRVVCVKSSFSGVIKKGHQYTVAENIYCAKCDHWHTAVEELGGRNGYFGCTMCCSNLKRGTYAGCCSNHFAPIPPRSIEIPESLKEQAEEMKDLAETIAPMKKELV